MPKRNNTTNLIHAAIDEACEDRAQFARDNEDCAPEDAREARQVEQEMAAWKHDNLKDGARWTPGSLREKGLAFFDPVCQALYFAIISRTARIIALENTNAGTGEDVAWRGAGGRRRSPEGRLTDVSQVLRAHRPGGPKRTGH